MASFGLGQPDLHNEVILDKLAVYTWGEDNYDSLGSALEERGDDLNDETFGSSETIGKDFDFAGQTFAALSLADHNNAGDLSTSVSSPLHRHPSRDARWSSEQAIGRPSGEVGDVNPARATHSLSTAPYPSNHASTFSPFDDVVRTESLKADGGLVHPSYAQFTRQPPPPSFQPHQAGIPTVQQANSQERASILHPLYHQNVLPERLPFEYAPVHPGSSHPVNLGDLRLFPPSHPHPETYGALPPQPQSGEDDRDRYLLGPAGLDNNLNPEQRDALMGEAMKKILEAEHMEERRRRRAAKMAHMSRYNDLMTQSDKDFITRIQVSQLVTQDPYTEDFYAQVYMAIIRSRMGSNSIPDQSVLKFGGVGGVGLGVPGRRSAGRAESAMQRMQSQVERIVNNAQVRDKAKNTEDINKLQGVLGKVSGRSYKAAPRQLLQVTSNEPIETATPRTGNEQTISTTPHMSSHAASIMHPLIQTSAEVRRPPISSRQIHSTIESLYDAVLALEQLHRDISSQAPSEVHPSYLSRKQTLMDELWSRSMVMLPIETSDPHPFISVLFPLKGKRLLPRLVRLLPEDQTSLLMVLFLACFHQLDVVRNAPLLDRVDLQATAEWKETSIQTDTFLAILPSITSILAGTSLRLLTGFLNILLGAGHHAVLHIAKSQPGIALLTAFMSRADQLHHDDTVDAASSQEDWHKWDTAFDNLLTVLHGNLLTLFPSNRVATFFPPGHLAPNLDMADQIVWQLLAALAAIGTQQQQMQVVAEVKDMVLDIVQSVHGGWITNSQEASSKLSNVNILLRAIGLDDTQLLAP